LPEASAHVAPWSRTAPALPSGVWSPCTQVVR